MIRGTTPTIAYRISSTLDFSKIVEAEITVAQELKKETVLITKYYSEGNVICNAQDRLIYMKLSQEETLSFSDGQIEVQLRLLLEDDLAMATKVKVTSMNKLLEGGVISE